MGFALYKAAQPLRGIELQDKKDTKRFKCARNMFRKNLLLIDAC